MTSSLSLGLVFKYHTDMGFSYQAAMVSGPFEEVIKTGLGYVTI